MNSRWHANKIGLINFWYYDEQEFPFVRGRMLLRGSNGSGKSVTMQSVVPLLLDGNMSPERLDPFGSKDRKMSSYLLEEDDTREERTAYLYLEFRRADSEVYLTVGMGMRARKGKPLDKWYFGLTDGRRVGHDFLLYKETDEKVTLSRKELENRIGSGGQVFDRQADYMEYVNRQIFGFDTVDEYKEMIDLLIQLRTPKLSKDFKPSVINDILSDSLQPLSDDDLRPMSEAIENMDTMNMNLKSRQEAKQAAEKIDRVYDRYNRLVLLEKASKLERENEHLSQLKTAEQNRRAELQDCRDRIVQLDQERNELDAKKDSMEKEKESLNRSDAVHLKMRETELRDEIAVTGRNLQDKEGFLQTKQEQYQDARNKQKEEEDRQYHRKKEISEILEEMQSEADDMAFEEHAFFKEELLENLEAEFSFETHREQFEACGQAIRQGRDILRETTTLEQQADGLLKEREEKQRELDSQQRKVSGLENDMFRAQSEWKEALYSWNGRNRQLKLTQELLRELAEFVGHYSETSDFATVRQKVADVWLAGETELETAIAENRKTLSVTAGEIEETRAELAEWENSREPQPPRTEAVLKNRERLDALNIPYQEFYKVLEFGEKLTDAECSRLEEALMQMGILDALVVDEQYREQVLRLAEGCEDRYLFVQKTRADKSLLDVLELNDNVNDIFSNGRITAILQNIAYDGEGAVSVSKDGTYRMGVLAGTVTGQHNAGFLGTRARERNRLDKIRECREKLELLERECQTLQGEIERLSQRKELLQKEYHELPDDHALRDVFLELKAAEREAERIQSEGLRLEEKLKVLTAQIREKKKEALSIAERLYLNCSYEVFQRAAEAADCYNRHFIELQSKHQIYLVGVCRVGELAENMDNLDADMEQIRYDIRALQKDLEKKKAEYESVTEQLKLTDYEEIKGRLDACIQWLKDYPERLQRCVTQKTQNTERIKVLEQQEETGTVELLESEQKRLQLEKSYEAERALRYVELSEDGRESPAEICRILGQEGKDWKKEDIIRDLNRVYFENRGFLNDYQLMQSELFEELGDAKRLDISARYQGVKLPFKKLLSHLEEDIAELLNLIKDGDRELFEDILANTVGRKIRGKINGSNAWVGKMNALMESMNTSSGLKLSLRWRSRTAETEDQLDTKELVELLRKDYRLMGEEEAAKLSRHFRSKVEEARRHAKDSGGMISFYQVMKDTLDYRKWFEFQLFSQKSGERIKELTNSVFGTFSGGEKAMSMYVPLFSAVVAKYQGGREDAPRLISLDEAFAGVDNKNIRDMFRLMTEFGFDFIMNSQVLWGDCDTLDALAIYQLLRPQNAKFVTVMPYLWNGHAKELLESEQAVELRGAEIGQTGRN